MRWYLDSSAIIKLIKFESESKALESALPKNIATSQLARVEVIRTIAIHAPDLLESAYDVLIDIAMIPLDRSVLSQAENLPPFIKLRALDSIHLASALFLLNEVGGIITYDKEMITAAHSLGLTTLSPGMK